MGQKVNQKEQSDREGEREKKSVHRCWGADLYYSTSQNFISNIAIISLLISFEISLNFCKNLRLIYDLNLLTVCFTSLQFLPLLFLTAFHF